MEEKKSRELAQQLLQALSAQDVQNILEEVDAKYWFDTQQNWRPYGQRDKNWDTIGNQQSNPVGALVEVITNGIDAILLKKAREAGITDFRSEKAPQSMHEAVRKFFPQVVEGKIANLDPSERANLAEQSVQIGVKRSDRANSRYPTYTIIDSGCGQKPEEFESTFLSLSAKNKEGIPFVQGKFNMGSTGSLSFCTRSDIRLGHYKLIISRSHDCEYWGWTLLRIRGQRAGEELPVTEYFAPNGNICRFRSPKVSAFGHEVLGNVSVGSVIRLYEYDVSGTAYQVDLGLYYALTASLFDCALPVQLYDFDAKPVFGKGKLREEGIAPRTFGGLSVVLRSDVSETSEETSYESEVKGKTEWVRHVLDEKHEDLGHIKILAIAVSKLQGFLEKHPARIFYTVNGQTHATECASFLNTRVGLGDLRNHILVNVICDGMNKRALSAVFMPNREQIKKVELGRILEEVVVRALKEDPKLREYAAEIRRRRATEHAEDKEETKDFLSELVKLDPAMKDLFGLGVFLPEISQTTGGQKLFEGKKFPTFLEPLNLRLETNQHIKEIPIGSYRRIQCGTDAENEYLSRIDSPGESWCSLCSEKMPHNAMLHNGTATFTIKTPKNISIGESIKAEFGFIDTGRNHQPLKFEVLIRYVEAEKPKQSKSGQKRNTKNDEVPSLAMPDFEWVSEADWNEHEFTEDSGAYVSTGEKTTIYINRDNKYLKALRVKEKEEATRIHNEHMFRFGLGIMALSIHKKASNGEGVNPEDIVRLATEAMSAHIVTIIRRLGGAEAK